LAFVDYLLSCHVIADILGLVESEIVPFDPLLPLDPPTMKTLP